MNDDRLAAILNSYGGNPEHWPVEEREAAAVRLAEVSPSQGLRRSQEYLDSALDALPEPPPPSRYLRHRIIALGQQSRADASWRALWLHLIAEIGGGLRTAGGLAACFAIGITAGLMITPMQSNATTDASMESNTLLNAGGFLADAIPAEDF